jgi:TPR repeat protein
MIRNPELAISFFRKAAAVGNAVAEVFLGNALINHDKKAALELYRAAMRQQNAMGQTSYGVSLMEGRGTVPQLEKGIRFIKMAADQGYGEANRIFANCLERGIGIKPDIQSAMIYYARAVEADAQKESEKFELWYNE